MLLFETPTVGCLLVRVRAEDVLREPHSWLPVILPWLGVPVDAQLIARMLRTEERRFAGTGASGRLFGGDQSFFRSLALRDIPDSDPVSFDSARDLSPEMCRRMQALVSHLGY
jgi:hypothetical protein